MAIKQFNSVEGFSVGSTPNGIIDSNGNVSGNAITATANVTAPRLISNVSTGTAPLVVTSTTQVANLNVATAGAATTAGTVTTAAQPNITSVGTLSSLAVTGNANVGNLGTARVLATANVTAPQLISNVANGTAPFVVTSTTRVSNLNADLLGGLTTDTAGSNGTIVARTGNGQVVGSSLVSSVATGTAPLTVTSTTRVSNLNVAYANVADNINVATGTGNNFLIFANAATGNVAELTSTGLIANLSNNSITATTFVGALSGAATSATTAGTVTTAAQPNITSVGTLTSLAVTGNISGANLTGTHYGAATGLTSIPGGNVTGTVANATYATSAGSATNATTAGTVTTAAQPNITSTGTLTSLTVSGNTFLATSSGNVGIGTSSPGAKLETFNNIGGTVAIRMNTNFASGNYVDLNPFVSGVSNGGFSISLNGNIRQVIDPNGNVGIGTSSPIANLHVLGAAASTSVGSPTGTQVLSHRGSPEAGNYGASLNFVQQWWSGAPDSLVSVGQITGLKTAGGGNFGGGLAFLVGPSGPGSATHIEAMRIDGNSGGNVGIGTTSPAAKLDVVGNVRVKSSIAYNSPNGSNTITSTMENGGTLSWSGTAGQLFSITDSMTGNIFTVNDVSGIPMISVDSGGNIQFATSGGFVSYGVTSGITAAGSTQGTATSLTRPINVVSTVSASTGVILPTVPAGARVIVMNTSGTALNVYPPSGAIINSAATNVAYSMPAGARLEFISVSATQWYTMNATYG